MKKLVSLKLSKQNVATKIENARHYVTAMTGNPNFTTPSPTLASITTSINNLETAYNNAMGGGKVLTAIMRDKLVTLDNLLTQLSHYVEAIANGSDTIILSAGMNLKVIAGGGRPNGFIIKKGDQSGELKLSTTYEKSHAYIWEMVADPLPDETPNVIGAGSSEEAHTWKQVGVTTKASFTMDGLVAGLKYWFRVATVGKEGQNDWSDPIGRMASE